MADITRYVVSKTPNDWYDGDEYEEREYERARAEAHRIDGCVTAVTYTFDDSELIDDFRKVHIDDGNGGVLCGAEDALVGDGPDDASCPECIEANDNREEG